MPDIKFDFRGKEFTAQVPDSFLQRPKVEQQRLLLNNLKKKYEGMKSGWLGEDEVRTQDMLPDNLSPFTKGVLGFAGDVATDPLTWFAPGIVRGTGALIRGAGEKTGATPVLKRAGEKVMDAKFGKNDIGIPDLARLFNVPGRTSKGDDRICCSTFSILYC
jgi:hypothetical protein